MGLKSANNAKALVQGTLLASGGFVTVKDSKGGLFPVIFPYRCTLTKFLNQAVTQRELVEVTNRIGDIFTITRAVEAVPSSDTATTQTTTAFAFSDNDSFQLTRPAFKDDELEAETALKLNKQDYLKGDLIFGSTSTGNDDYSITVDSGITALTNGQPFRFLSDVTNIGTASLNVNSIGAKTILKANDVVLQDGDIEANQIVEVVFNSIDDVFEMTSQISTLPTVDINGLTAKTVPVNADEFIIFDSVGVINKKLTYLNLKNNILASVPASITDVGSIIATRQTNASSGTIVYNHNLGKVPKMIKVDSLKGGATVSGSISSGSWLTGNINKCAFSQSAESGSATSSTFAIVSQEDDFDGQEGIITNVTSTQLSVTWTLTTSPLVTTIGLHFTLFA